MSRIVLVHWDARSARCRIARLGDAGYDAELFPGSAGSAPARLWRRPPDAFVIDLGRLPSQGRDLAVLLRRRASTRRVPLVFCGARRDATERVRQLLPDAVYTSWLRIADDLARALEKPPAEPVVPPPMAAYSATPLPRKLGLVPDSVVALLAAPEGFEKLLEPLPDGLVVRRAARGKARTILLFARRRQDLVRRFPAAERALAEGGGLWILWPKKASGVASDLDQTAVRTFGLEAGLVDYKICAVDETWSGLLFARRKK